jgi:hypothetical protein
MPDQGGDPVAWLHDLPELRGFQVRVIADHSMFQRRCPDDSKFN